MDSLERGHPGRVAGGTPALPGQPVLQGYHVEAQPPANR